MSGLETEATQLTEQLLSSHPIVFPSQQLLDAVETKFVELHLPLDDKIRPDVAALCQANWDRRERLSSILKPKQFLGRLSDITIRFDPDASFSDYETHRSQRLVPGMRVEKPQHIAKLHIVANLISNSSRAGGTLDRDVWYLGFGAGSSSVKQATAAWRRVFGVDYGTNNVDEVMNESKRRARTNRTEVSNRGRVASSGRTRRH